MKLVSQQSDSNVMTRQDIQDNYPDSELLLLEEKYFDAAIIGVASRVNTPWAVCYDANKCIELLAKHEGMTLDEAANVSNTCTSAGAPNQDYQRLISSFAAEL